MSVRVNPLPNKTEPLPPEAISKYQGKVRRERLITIEPVVQVLGSRAMKSIYLSIPSMDGKSSTCAQSFTNILAAARHD